MDLVYFQRLEKDLKQHGTGCPQLIVDKVQLMHNLVILKSLFKDQIAPRLVVKSLSNLSLLKLISDQMNTKRFMVFHLPQLIDLLDEFLGADVLLGKPMPIRVIRQFYQGVEHAKTSNIQWLIDSVERLKQYLTFAKELDIKLKINIEIDVGLHRGGVHSEEEFLKILQILTQYRESLIFSGLMGYDAHVAKLPKWLKKTQEAYQESQQMYASYKELILKHHPELWHEGLCFNGGGSPTLTLHTQNSVCNDVAFGSVVVKPSDFDIELLSEFKPALWLATPVLKVLPKVKIPALEVLQKLPVKQNAIFIYGGYWMADYIYPKGLKINPLYGRSTNQELLTLSQKQSISIDDYVIARPQQSEVMIPQFEFLYVYDQHQFHQTLNMRE